jgi:hypothetical protein
MSIPTHPLRGKPNITNLKRASFVHLFRASLCLFGFFPDSSPPDVPPLHRPPLTTYGRSLPINTSTYYTCTSHEAATFTIVPAILGVFRFTLVTLSSEEYDFRSLFFSHRIFHFSSLAHCHSAPFVQILRPRVLSRACHSKSRSITGFIFGLSIYQEAPCPQMYNSI